MVFGGSHGHALQWTYRPGFFGPDGADSQVIVPVSPVRGLNGSACLRILLEAPSTGFKPEH